MSRGIVAEMPTGPGGFIIPKSETSGNFVYTIVNVPENTRIFCTTCTATYDTNNPSNVKDSLKSTDYGYYVSAYIEELTISRPTTNTAPLTIIHDREILYADIKNNKVNLPIGSRINDQMITAFGDTIITSSDNYLIEY